MSPLRIQKSACLIVCVVVCAICSACSSSERKTTAQINSPTETPSNKQVKTNSAFFDIRGDVCRFFGEDFYKKPDYDKFSELKNAGYPKEVSLDEAVEFFNRLAQCSEVGKTQPPLRPQEVTGAIALWDCLKETEAYQSKPFDENICQQFDEIAKSGKLPKGAWLDHGGGTCENCKGYTATVWEIRLYLRQDKYRRDYKDNPIISRLLRLNYPSAERNKE